MPKISVSVEHNETRADVVEKVKPALEKTAKDFEGKDVKIEWKESSADFSFKSMAFTINGSAAVDDKQVTVDVDLPFAAMLFKDKAEKAIRKNLTRALGVEAE